MTINTATFTRFRVTARQARPKPAPRLFPLDMNEEDTRAQVADMGLYGDYRT